MVGGGGGGGGGDFGPAGELVNGTATRAGIGVANDLMGEGWGRAPDAEARCGAAPAVSAGKVGWTTCCPVESARSRSRASTERMINPLTAVSVRKRTSRFDGCTFTSTAAGSISKKTNANGYRPLGNDSW